MILLAHVREDRHISVSNDTTAFGKKDCKLRQELETLCSTQIMTADEFVMYCDVRRQRRV